MSFDEHYMDTTVDEIMDLLYEDQKIVPKKPLNRKPFIRKVGSGQENMLQLSRMMQSRLLIQ